VYLFAAGTCFNLPCCLMLAAMQSPSIY
jgi:hypothetical protein